MTLTELAPPTIPGAGLVVSDTGRAIVASIVELSHALGMAVVAEGVETQAQLDHLVAIGCDRAQGFLFAPAGPAELIEERVLHPVPTNRDLRRQGVRSLVRPVSSRAGARPSIRSTGRHL